MTQSEGRAGRGWGHSGRSCSSQGIWGYKMGKRRQLTLESGKGVGGLGSVIKFLLALLSKLCAYPCPYPNLVSWSTELKMLNFLRKEEDGKKCHLGNLMGEPLFSFIPSLLTLACEQWRKQGDRDGYSWKLAPFSSVHQHYKSQRGLRTLRPWHHMNSEAFLIQPSGPWI